MSDVPDPLANLDQHLRGLADLARVVGTYYTELIAQGFAVDQAFGLAVAYQQAILAQ